MTTQSPQQSRATDISVVAAVVSALSIIVALVGVGFGLRAVSDSKGTDTVAAAAAASPTVTLTEFKISPAAITAPLDGTITVVNKGTMQHNLHVDGQKNLTAMIDGGATTTLSLAGLPAGTYKVICDVPGHSSAGMTADLTIGGSGASSAAGPAAT
ncbi:MAG TPA: cupredoxin domain-containing protein, partial [Acidimicrobiales bacterium]|nr:cupredoxin domain-containing protein [Acidimicrobiales bacterium]